METTGFLNRGERKTTDPGSATKVTSGDNTATRRHKISFTAILSFVAIIALSVLTAIVLHVSNGDDIASWPVQPSVYLSLIAAGLGPAVAYIYGQGVQVDFWLFCIRGGSLSQIDDRWQAGGDIVAASLLSLRHRRISRIALACVAVTAMAVQGTFLQNASRAVPTQRRQTAVSHLNIAPELPSEFTSTFTGRVTDSAVLNPTFASVLQQFQARSTMTVNSTCAGSCSGTVAAAGLAATCSTSPYNWTFANDFYDIYPPVQFNAFNISFGLSHDTVPDGNGDPLYVPNTYYQVWRNSRLTVDFYVKDGRPATMDEGNSVTVGFHRRCVLRPATISYPVLISNSTIKLQGQMLEDEALELLDVYERGSYGSGSGTTWLGYASTVAELYATYVNVSYAGAAGYTYTRSGLFGTAYLETLGDVAIPGAMIDVAFRDPTKDVLEGMRELTFRMALSAARDPGSGRWLGKHKPPGTDTNTSSPNYGDYNASVASALPFNISSPTVETRNLTVYRTDWVYGSLGIAWTFGMLVLIAPTFYGFWLLERRVSLSPLETAKAFRSPLLDDVDPRADLNMIRAQAGDIRVRYEESRMEVVG
ncbi:hypothetical protein G647_06135 [Cladophialophora carrionii CBS 160.54]|uniref:Uncharacterized protein n=1 Tax=Cladophialophora carrionii CBS 160.54 TaxID=1279043 RepID=V9D590_9EURO|nr:uncharacterized protein G647_06135 [Cladophialophora carrionii CBS 160.54]ETI22064.1 hypothetical protein G647_06135 [Cladophialophora carrionii CBS 160.54]